MNFLKRVLYMEGPADDAAPKPPDWQGDLTPHLRESQRKENLADSKPSTGPSYESRSQSRFSVNVNSRSISLSAYERQECAIQAKGKDSHTPNGSAAGLLVDKKLHMLETRVIALEGAAKQERTTAQADLSTITHKVQSLEELLGGIAIRTEREKAEKAIVQAEVSKLLSRVQSLEERHRGVINRAGAEKRESEAALLSETKKIYNKLWSLERQLGEVALKAEGVKCDKATAQAEVSKVSDWVKLSDRVKCLERRIAGSITRAEAEKLSGKAALPSEATKIEHRIRSLEGQVGGLNTRAEAGKRENATALLSLTKMNFRMQSLEEQLGGLSSRVEGTKTLGATMLLAKEDTSRRMQALEVQLGAIISRALIAEKSSATAALTAKKIESCLKISEERVNGPQSCAGAAASKMEAERQKEKVSRGQGLERYLSGTKVEESVTRADSEVTSRTEATSDSLSDVDKPPLITPPVASAPAVLLRESDDDLALAELTAPLVTTDRSLTDLQRRLDSLEAAAKGLLGRTEEAEIDIDEIFMLLDRLGDSFFQRGLGATSRSQNSSRR